MIDFWYELPPLLRAGFGLLLIGIAVLIFFATDGTRIAIGLGILGFIFLVFCRAGHSDGYNF